MEFTSDTGKSTFVACQDKDYALALENELSDRWMRAFRRRLGLIQEQFF